MEPLTALSLASAIVQFVDFGSKILKAGYEVYQSASGLAQEHVDLAELTTSLYSFQTRLASPSASTAAPTPDEKALQELAARCSELANQLLRLLSSLQVKGDGLIRTWESLRQTLRSIGKKKQISRLEKLLDEIGRQISSRLLYLIREDTSSLSMQIRSLNSASDRLNLQLKAGLEDARKLIIAELEAQSTALGQIQSAVKDDQSRKHHVEVLKAYYASLQVVPNHLTQLNDEVTRVSKSQRLLESLRFKEISDREFQIHESHGDTFEWIFEDDNTAFKRWLSEGNDVFWVCGKAGSGKSTLMKFLAQHDKTKTLLEEWAGDERLIFASYYFWSSGFDIQKSQLGLMQSLLYQILRQFPDLMPFASVRRWQATELEVIAPDPWTQIELSSAFDNILSQGRLTSRFCFFVDGLDEYSGDHHKLMKVFGRLSQSSQVKFCVSSRPWRVFKNHYGQNIDLKLVLEDLTRNDIFQYVETVLHQDERFQQLAAREPAVSSIVGEIRDRAEGVFLWVFLVVRSLLRGLDEDDNASELEERLSGIPTDLNAFFRKMLQNIDDTYRDYTMRALQLAAIDVPMFLVAFAYIARDLKDPSFALKVEIAPLKTDESEAFCEQAARKVTKWCRDLLEVNHDPHRRYKWGSGMVMFLHRSAKDFLLLPETQETFRANPVCGRSIHDTLCKIHLAAIKGHYDTSLQSVSQPGAIMDLIAAVLEYAKQRETVECLPSFEVLRELDKVLEATNREKAIGWILPSVLKLAVREDLVIYVGHMISKDPSKIHDLLPYAILQETEDELSSSIERPSIGMLHCLLVNGVDPNEKLRILDRKEETVWQEFLADCLRRRGGEMHDEWAIAKLMLQHGADPEAKAKNPAGGKPMNIRSCFLEMYDSQPWEHELDQVLADCRAKWKVQHSWRAKLKRRLRV